MRRHSRRFNSPRPSAPVVPYPCVVEAATDFEHPLGIARRNILVRSARFREATPTVRARPARTRRPVRSARLAGGMADAEPVHRPATVTADVGTTFFAVSLGEVQEPTSPASRTARTAMTPIQMVRREGVDCPWPLPSSSATTRTISTVTLTACASTLRPLVSARPGWSIACSLVTG